MEIKVTHYCVDTDKTETRDILYSGELSARRLARAVKIIDEWRDYLRANFGPGVIYPYHRIYMTIDGKCHDHMDLMLNHSEGSTWGQITDNIANV